MALERNHILVISQYFYPETFRINDICLDLVKRGHKVTVLTGYPNYPNGEFYEGYSANKIKKESYKGIDVIRLPIIARGSKKITLALNYLSFVVSGFFWKLFNDIEANSVFIYEVSPMTQALPGVWYADKHNIPCYLYVTDLWPENVEIAGGITNKYIINNIGRMVDYIYKKCTKILTSSESFINRIVERGVPNEKIEFWPQYAEDFYFPVDNNSNKVSEIPNDEILNLTFAGNIGYAQGLEILPQVALKLKENAIKVRFNLIGDGRYKVSLIKNIEKLDVDEYFNFINQQPATEIKKYMASSDASLVLLSENKLYELYIPAKLQSSMACGIPIIGSISGETKNIIEKANIGYCSDAGDVDSLFDNIIKFNYLNKKERDTMGKNALDYFKIHFEKKRLMNRLENLLTNDLTTNEIV